MKWKDYSIYSHEDTDFTSVNISERQYIVKISYGEKKNKAWQKNEKSQSNLNWANVNKCFGRYSLSLITEWVMFNYPSGLQMESSLKDLFCM